LIQKKIFWKRAIKRPIIVEYYHTEHPEVYKAVSKNMIFVEDGIKYEL